MQLSALARRMPLAVTVGLAGWWACGSDKTTAPPDPPRPTQVVKVSGDAQSGIVAQALLDPLVVRVIDQFGAPLSGTTVNFAITAGGGAVSAASGMTDGSGQANVSWTMGTVSGSQRLNATASGTSVRATFSATALADVPSSVTEVAGNNQVAPRNAPVQNPLVVRVADQFDNGVPAVAVEFEVLTGGGSISPLIVDTDQDGHAATTWTLGDPEGQQTAEARAAVVPGVTVSFQAQAVNFRVDAISPDTLVEGQSATITGEGFDAANLGNNVVTIDGIAATVTAASPTQLTATVPAFDCRPTRSAGVVVGQSGFSLPAVNHPVRPAAFLSLAVGEMQLIQDPAKFCLQFPAASVGGEAYIMGVGSVVENPTALMFYTMTGVAGTAAAAPGPASPPPAPSTPASSGFALFGDLSELEARRAHLAAELRLRAKEREQLDLRRVGTGRMLRAAAAQAVPAVGDTLKFRVPNLDGNLCQFTEVTTVVRVVGNSGVFVADTANPVAGGLSDAELQAASDTFDLFSYAVDTLYFGPPSDLDANDGRVVIVLSLQVNKMSDGQVAGFVTSADLFDRALCASSDNGEIFYSHVPDPGNKAGTGARTTAAVLAQMPSLIAHEFAHIIQFTRRIFELGSNFVPDTWELEGQATLAEEVVGHAIIGNMPGQDIGASQVLPRDQPGFAWYNSIFAQLATYYGWQPPDQHGPNAPEQCTLFGNSDINQTTACEPFWFYGASWSFQRYILDRFGPSRPNGERDLSRGWLDANPGLDGVDNVEMLVGAAFDSLFAKWSAIHWADGRIAGADATLQTTSWDLFNIFSSSSTAGIQLTPLELSFATFANSRSVRGGSTAYTRLSAAGARPALAIRVRGGAGAFLSMASQPQFWIVREQ